MITEILDGKQIFNTLQDNQGRWIEQLNVTFIIKSVKEKQAPP